ncbi:MAG: toll/interleukin-1 receptor domain-containing protein [Magnetococcus sp. YQC-5]
MPYQVLLLDPDQRDADSLIRALRNNFEELGLDPNQELVILDAALFSDEYQPAFPIVGVYLAHDYYFFDPDTESSLAQLAQCGASFFPVTNEPGTFKSNTPTILHDYNGLFRNLDINWLATLVSRILESFHLLRTRRRIFISYLRRQSQGIANQLYRAFHERTYDVFMDVHEILPGEKVQQTLLHHLVDSDLLLFLDTPESSLSPWVTKELDTAELNGVGIYQLIWPAMKAGSNYSGQDLSCITQQRYIDATAFLFGTILYNDQDSLTNQMIAIILGECEELRAKVTRNRFERMATYCQDEAARFNLSVINQGVGVLEVQRNRQCLGRIKPIGGVPVSMDYQRFHNPADPIDRRLFYRDSAVDPQWKEHLIWLDNSLPLRTETQATLDQWLGGL